ncbi:hypothetical protein [Calothrix sp. CCY 0018]|uniref:hypothetical protein n=1 Tax=Calothrix sp. CCY 0018 TaxID=3103864 RepID=UPI0039C6F965
MWRRILSFFGWLWAGLFILVGLTSIVENPALAFTCIIWGLIFLPLLFRFTSSYGLRWNIGGRILAFFISIVIFGMLSPTEPQAIQPTPSVKTAPTNVETESPARITTPPAFTPTAEPAPTLEPDITPAPEIIKTSEPKPVIEPVPEVVNTPEPEPPQNISKPNIAPVLDPNAPVRASISGKCDCPYDTDSRGRSCGKRSAYSRPSGASPVCYISDR